MHELAHLATAFALGVKVKQVGLSWKGPYVRRESGTAAQNLAITVSGPGLNLLLAAATLHVHPIFAVNNLVLGVFNLLPIPSSDGKRALALLRGMIAPVVRTQSTAAEAGEASPARAA